MLANIDGDPPPGPPLEAGLTGHTNAFREGEIRVGLLSRLFPKSLEMSPHEVEGQAYLERFERPSLVGSHTATVQAFPLLLTRSRMEVRRDVAHRGNLMNSTFEKIITHDASEDITRVLWINTPPTF